MEKQKAKLSKWYLTPGGHLIDIVSGHPKLADGKEVMTTQALKVETRNTVYDLGEPLELYTGYSRIPEFEV